MSRPDFSNYVAHFTKDSPPFNNDRIESEQKKKIAGMTALQKVTAILESGSIFATPMPWTNKDAVAFTECPWGSLLDHSNQYSPYGIGFTKAHLFAAAGGPAIYMKPDLYQDQMEFHLEGNDRIRGFHKDVYAFITPFLPPYASQDYKDKYGAQLKGKIVDWTHEREWRVPHDFTFRLDQVQFVILDTYKDMAQFPQKLKDGIGREKFILMENYRQIEKLWPVHLLPEA